MKAKERIARAREKIREKLKSPGRRTRYERSTSLELERGNMPPGDRGACEQKSSSQGSE
jgi:hypothetical protein